MTWWGWILIGLLTAASIFLLIAYIRKPQEIKRLTDEEKKELVDAEKRDLETRLKASQEAEQKLEEQALAHKNAREKLKLALAVIKESIDANKRKEVDEILADDDALSDELDRLAGVE